MKKISIQRIWSSVIVCLALLLSTHGWAADKGPKGPQSMPPVSREGQGRGLETVRVTIEKKNLEKVTTNTGDRFTLSENTIIVNTDGRQIGIREMRVPCDVEIGYRTENGVRLAERIDIQHVGSDARWQWTSDRPE
ncbi:MAG: hypothetical protein HY911_03085 [Desulfobacterales bacterium]|nr:hypothetical protein [Desulfobacterales bacterium]